jgi:hypothetical protein
LLGQARSDAYFEGRDDTRNVILDTHETIHIGQVQAVDWALFRPRNGRKLFKEADANWLFFYAIAHYCNLHSELDKDTLKITTKL